MAFLTFLLSSEGVLVMTVTSVAMLIGWFQFIAKFDKDPVAQAPSAAAVTAGLTSHNPSVRRRAKAVKEGRAAPTGYMPAHADPLHAPSQLVRRLCCRKCLWLLSWPSPSHSPSHSLPVPLSHALSSHCCP